MKKIFNYCFLLLLLVSCSITKTHDQSDPDVTVPSEERVYFKNNSSLTYVAETIKVATCVLNNQDFQKEISEISSFDYTTDSGEQVLLKIKSGKIAQVGTYKSFNPWSAAIAYSSGGYIYYNTRKNPREMKYMVNTLTHEYLHVIGYGHGDNYSEGKDNSAPYLIGTRSEKFVEVCL